MKILRPAVVALAAACVSLPAQAGYAFSFAVDPANLGTVGPTDPGCPDPFAGCFLTAQATIHAVSGITASWQATSTFRLLPPPGVDGLFDTEGSFYWDDASVHDDDLWGTWTGAFNPATFSNLGHYVVAGGSGRFSGLQGSGQSFIQVIPGPALPFGYLEAGDLQVPEPATALLVTLAAGGLLAVRRGRGRSASARTAPG